MNKTEVNGLYENQLFNIKITNLKKTFKKIVALNGVNLNFKHGEITGLIGFNGSGKTTTFNSISGLIQKIDSGEILINGMKLNNQIRKQFSYLSAGSELANQDRVKDHLKYIGKLYGLTNSQVKNKIDVLLKKFDFTSSTSVRIKTLSKGNQQKIKLTSVFLNPNLKYLLLDEPLDGLDPIIVQKIYKFLFENKENLTTIITSHRMDAIDTLCDSYYILKEGNIVEYFSKNENKTIIVNVNKEIEFSKTIRSLDFVITIIDSLNEKIIKINDINNFKKLSLELLNCKGYVYHSVESKNIAKSIMENYS